MLTAEKEVKEVKTPPMFEHKFLAHALGGYRGYKLLNCEEAFIHSYQKGFRYFEVDLKTTSDDKLVCSYGWKKELCERTGMAYDKSFDEDMSHEKFMQQKVHGMPVTDAKRLCELMKQYEDTYLEIDLKTLEKDDAAHYAKLIYDLFGSYGLLERILIQANTKEMYEGLMSVYHFPWIQFNVRGQIGDLDDFIAFCKENDICAIAIKGMHTKPGNMKKIKKAGLRSLVYTIDSRTRAQRYLTLGASTICTNFLTPTAPAGQKDDLVYIGYHSTLPAKEQYSELIERHILRGDLDTLPDGSVQYGEIVNSLRDWEYHLTDCLFKRRFSTLEGWELRVKKGRDKEWLWYCTDKKYHTVKEIKDSKLKKVLFKNGELIDLNKIFYRERMVFEARWKKKF